MSDLDPIDVALGDLSADERARADERLRRDAAFRDEVDRLRTVVTGLRDMPSEAWDLPAAGTPPDPDPDPDAGRGRVETPSRRPGSWSRVPRLSPLAASAATAAALVAGLVAGATLADRLGSPDEPRARAVMRLDPLPASASARGDARMLDDGRIEIDTRGLPPSTGGAVYTVWLLNKDMTMEPVGSFRVAGDGPSVVTMPMPYRPSDFDFLDISREPSNGDPGHSGDSVLRGPTT